ncbi:hypothetical protein KKG46_06020 [Patescibacteria group bacterium]|nr:hypothetical protein [Patescibacteria group bacterium]
MKICLKVLALVLLVVTSGCMASRDYKRVNAPGMRYEKECLVDGVAQPNCEETLDIGTPGTGAYGGMVGTYGVVPQMYAPGYTTTVIDPLLPDVTCWADNYGNRVCGAIPYTETGNAPNPGDTPNGRIESVVRQNREQIQNLNEHQVAQDRCINGACQGGK